MGLLSANNGRSPNAKKLRLNQGYKFGLVPQAAPPLDPDTYILNVCFLHSSHSRANQYSLIRIAFGLRSLQRTGTEYTGATALPRCYLDAAIDHAGTVIHAPQPYSFRSLPLLGANANSQSCAYLPAWCRFHLISISLIPRRVILLQ